MKLFKFFGYEANKKSANESDGPTTPMDRPINPDFVETLPSDSPIVIAQVEKERERIRTFDIRATEIYQKIQQVKKKYAEATKTGNIERQRELSAIQQTLEARLKILDDEGYLEINEDTSIQDMRKAIAVLTERLGTSLDQVRTEETLALLQNEMYQREQRAQDASADEKIKLLLKKQNIRPLTTTEESELEIAIATQINRLSDQKNTAPLAPEQLQKLDTLLSTYIDVLIRRKNTTGLTKDENEMLDALIEEKANLFQKSFSNEELVGAA